MLKIDYDYSSLKLRELKKNEQVIGEIIENFKKGNCLGKEFIGWYNYPVTIERDLIEYIKKDAEKIVANNDVFVVCGIGGSYLGARAVIEAIVGFKCANIEIVYMGNTFDEKYTLDILDYLKDKDFFVNVISKSGSTLETAFAFRKLKELLIEKYGDNYNEKIIATTDEKNGCLRLMADKEGYRTYVIPENIGGRYSVFTPVGLLPIAVAGVDIESFLNGAKLARNDLENSKFENHVAFQYASYRYLQYMNGNKIEVFSTYTPYLNMFMEWWKQLFGESEGKCEKGLFPASVTFSTDLHSLGQFIQQGTKTLFITQIRIEEKGNLKIKKDKFGNLDNLDSLDSLTLAELNLKAQTGTNIAHHKMGNVDNFTFSVDVIDENTLGYLMFVMMYSCMISGYLLDVNPFDQPGVEFYKKEMKKLL